MIDKPSDLVVIFVLVGLVVTGFGLLYADVDAWTAPTNDSTRVFANMSEYATSGSFVKGSSDDMTSALGLENAAQNEEGFISAMFGGLLKVGKIWTALAHSLGNFGDELRIPTELLAIVSAGLVITFGLALYLWYRGK